MLLKLFIKGTEFDQHDSAVLDHHQESFRYCSCMIYDRLPHIIITIIYMLIVQYPMQFSRPRSISNPCPYRFVDTNGGSTNTTRVYAFHGLFLISKHY